MFGKKLKIRKKENNGSLNRIMLYIIPTAVGTVTFAALFCLLCLYTYSTGVINIFTVIMGWFCTAAGGFINGFLAHKNLGGRGIATGAVYGVIYCAAVLVIISVLSKTQSAGIFIGVPVSLVFSMFGGIADSYNKR